MPSLNSHGPILSNLVSIESVGGVNGGSYAQLGNSGKTLRVI